MENKQFLEHLRGIYQVFQARLSIINASIPHNLTQGEENERELRQLLIDMLPHNYGIDSGIIIDIDGIPQTRSTLLFLIRLNQTIL